MPLARIRRLLADGSAQPLSPDHCCWELRSRWWPFWRRAQRYRRLQLEILEAASTLPSTLHLVTDQNPQGLDVGGTWAHAHHRTYRVPPDCRLEALQDRVLRPGEWTLYASGEPIDPEVIPDCFEARPDQIAAFAATHGVPLLIQAARHDDPWRLWVEEVRTPQEVAA